MTQREKGSLVTGLPARFAGDQGFARLCDLLEINREERQHLAARIKRASPELRHPKNSTTKVRHQFYITHFYAQPHQRRSLWEKTLPVTKLRVANEPRSMPPSLECCALAASAGAVPGSRSRRLVPRVLGRQQCRSGRFPGGAVRRSARPSRLRLAPRAEPPRDARRACAAHPPHGFRSALDGGRPRRQVCARSRAWRSGRSSR